MLLFGAVSAQKVVGECTLNFEITASDTLAGKALQATLKKSNKIVYIKGNQSRTDLISPSFCQTTLFEKTTGKATVLREFGNNKFMTKLEAKQWEEANKAFAGVTLKEATGTRTIAGYECKMTVLQLKDGKKYSVFYTDALLPSVQGFEYQFKDIPGLVLGYEAPGEDGSTVTYMASKINFSPVPVHLFNIPTSGYRLL